MDFFAGNGTTLATAQKLNRKWIGVEMGDHFDEFYYDNGEKKVGLLGRMKLVLFGDKKINLLNRRPHLSTDINWNGGGIIKYYNLEQYEDSLSKSSYTPTHSQMSLSNGSGIFDKYVFFADNKMTDFIKSSSTSLDINFNNLYENIDFPETLSNLLGLEIVRVKKDSVILNDNGKNKEICFNIDKMNEQEKLDFLNLIKPLIWWGE